jgi:AcrR family transcriptional regulator
MKNRDYNDRREAFIETSIPLFIYKGYSNVSVRDVLDAVNDKTASPSVFYYYFSSKDELYRSCIEYIAESYISGFEKIFDLETDDICLALIGFRNNIRKWFHVGQKSSETQGILPWITCSSSTANSR